MNVKQLRTATIEQLRVALSDVANGPADTTRRFCLLIDADRTLAPQDTGRVVGSALGVDQQIRGLFERHGYTDSAFGDVADVWGRIHPAVYLAEVRTASAQVCLHDAWRTVMSETRGQAAIVVVTAGIPTIWRLVLDREGFGDVRVVGGCHSHFDDFVVSAQTKADLVGVLRHAGWKVIAAGDSIIDLPMLERADVPLFVPDYKGSSPLRDSLRSVPRVRHFAVDERRFEPLPVCTAEDLVTLIREGRWKDARRLDE